MSLTIKAFLLNTWGGDPLEIRRFTVDQDVTTSFTYLVQKIAQVFPSLRADNITVAWMGERTHTDLHPHRVHTMRMKISHLVKCRLF